MPLGGGEDLGVHVVADLDVLEDGAFLHKLGGNRLAVFNHLKHAAAQLALGQIHGKAEREGNPRRSTELIHDDPETFLVARNRIEDDRRSVRVMIEQLGRHADVGLGVRSIHDAQITHFPYFLNPTAESVVRKQILPGRNSFYCGHNIALPIQ